MFGFKGIEMPKPEIPAKKKEVKLTDITIGEISGDELITVIQTMCDLYRIVRYYIMHDSVNDKYKVVFEIPEDYRASAIRILGMEPVDAPEPIDPDKLAEPSKK